MLLVSTAVGVVDGVHGHPSDLGPLVALDPVLVVGATSLEDGLVSASAAGNEADHGAALGGDGLLAARRKADARQALLGVLGHDDGVVARGASHLAAVAHLGLNVADGRALGNGSNGENVANCQLSLLALVDELPSVETLRCGHQRIQPLEPVRVLELNLGHRSASSRVVENFPHDALNITVLFGKVQLLQRHGTLASASVCREHGALALALWSNNLAL